MHALVAVDLHVIWQQVFHPNSVLFRTLWATVYISVASQVAGVVLGLLAALGPGMTRRYATASAGMLAARSRTSFATPTMSILPVPRTGTFSR